LRPGGVPRQGVSGILSCPKGVKGGAAASFLHSHDRGTVKSIKKGLK
jgi:hypothetical protein